jgi:hypothetical protein
LLLFVVLAASGCYAPRAHTYAELRGRADAFVETVADDLPAGARVAVLPMEVYGEVNLDTEGYLCDILTEALQAKGYVGVVARPAAGLPEQRVRAAMASAGATHALQTFVSPTADTQGDGNRVDVRIDLAEDRGEISWLNSQTWTLVTREFSTLRMILLIVAIPIAIVITVFMIYLESEGIPVFRPHHMLPPPPHLLPHLPHHR